MAKFTVELPFEIGQGIWARTTVNGEEVDTLVTVNDYTINEFGVEISVSVPGKLYPEKFRNLFRFHTEGRCAESGRSVAFRDKGRDGPIFQG